MILTVLASYFVERNTKSTRKKEIRREGRKTKDEKKRGLKLYKKNLQNSLK